MMATNVFETTPTALDQEAPRPKIPKLAISIVDFRSFNPFETAVGDK